MHIETERKFLVTNETFKSQATESHRIIQGYIANQNKRSVRIRISDNKAFLTIKGPSTDTISHLEWEKEISIKDAKDLLKLCDNNQLIDKTRYIIPEGSGKKFEVDEFYGANKGLTVAEIELSDKNEPFIRPTWLGKEVSQDPRYYNTSLSIHPFTKW